MKNLRFSVEHSRRGRLTTLLSGQVVCARVPPLAPQHRQDRRGRGGGAEDRQVEQEGHTRQFYTPDGCPGHDDPRQSWAGQAELRHQPVHREHEPHPAGGENHTCQVREVLKHSYVDCRP